MPMADGRVPRRSAFRWPRHSVQLSIPYHSPHPSASARPRCLMSWAVALLSSPWTPRHDRDEGWTPGAAGGCCQRAARRRPEAGWAPLRRRHAVHATMRRVLARSWRSGRRHEQALLDSRGGLGDYDIDVGSPDSADRTFPASAGVHAYLLYSVSAAYLASEFVMVWSDSRLAGPSRAPSVGHGSCRATKTGR